jgi:hypothetical protein
MSTDTAPPFHSPEERLANLLAAVAKFTKPCEACGAMLFFVQHYGSEKYTPYTKQGINHFSNCTNPGLFRRPPASTPLIQRTKDSPEVARANRSDLMRRIDRPGNTDFDK